MRPVTRLKPRLRLITRAQCSCALENGAEATSSIRSCPLHGLPAERAVVSGPVRSGGVR